MSERLLEYTQITEAREVDEGKGILYDLAILGSQSANGRDYPESTMRGALPLFEGRQSFANHVKNGSGRGSNEPSVYDVVGVWRDCRVHEGKVRGNFHYFKSHPLAERLVEAAKRPELNNALGFSINARGKTRPQGKRQVVESLEEVVSIDCVAQPATLDGLYESRSPRVKKKLSELVEQLKTKRPAYAKVLQEAAESGVLSPSMPMDEPPPMEEAPADEVDHEQAILDACKACLDDASLDTAGKLKKIKDLLKVMGAETTATPPPPPGEETESDEEEDAEAEESRKKAVANLKEENARLKARDMIRTLADDAGVKVSKAFLEAVRSNITEAEVKAVIAELKGTTAPPPRKPGARSAAAWTEEPAKTVTEAKADNLTDDARKQRLSTLRSSR